MGQEKEKERRRERERKERELCSNCLFGTGKVLLSIMSSKFILVVAFLLFKG
jgi:hypothetical protein